MAFLVILRSKLADLWQPESRTQITQWPDASDSLQAVSSEKVPT